MTLPVVFTANGPSGYNLTKSLRFRASASAYLNRTPASAGNLQTWTYSVWVKRGLLTSGGSLQLLSIGAASNARTELFFDPTSIDLFSNNAGSTMEVTTSAVYRDASAWYHIVVAVDTTQATASNRVKMYVNGSQITAFSAANYPSLNYNTYVNSAGLHAIGRQQNVASNYFDGYMAEINLIDGQQLPVTSFGSFNSLTGVWQPVKYGGSYGTNGFYLPFTNTTSTTTLGYDFSGNSNNWTTNNLSLTTGSTYDSMTDVPTLTSATTANYAVINPLIYRYTSGNSTFSNGNLTITGLNTGNSHFQLASIAIPSSSSKFYWENTLGTTSSGTYLGITQFSNFQSANWDAWYDTINGVIYKGASSFASVATAASGDIVGIAYDSTANTCAFYKNNTLLTTVTGLTAAEQVPLMCTRQASVLNLNFGQQPFTYTPPTGFVALNTFNLPTSTIVKGNTVMDATLYTGTGSALSVTNTAGFKPDLVWIKGRSFTSFNGWIDSNRGRAFDLYSNSTSAEETSGSTEDLTSFNTNGFSLGTSARFASNNSGQTYVGWQWQAGQGSSSSNTSGSITSTVSVNASAGFSIVTYTGSGLNATVGHGLGVAPSWVIVKGRNLGSTNWFIYTATQGATKYLDFSSGTGGTDSSAWNNTAPTSSVFSVGTSYYTNFALTTYVAYCWAEIAGFSKFGSYTGNGSTDGPFVYTGFRPAFIMIKRTDTGGTDWVTMDNKRLGYNVTDVALNPNANYAENSGYATDFTSNGFKLRTTTSFLNGSGATYIYMAFAENPFKNALAR